LIDYFLAELVLRRIGARRLDVLERAQRLYESYLERLDTYRIISSKDQKLYERFLEDRNAFSLASPTDAAARRQVKVARYQDEKALKQKLDVRVPIIEPPVSNNAHSILRKIQVPFKMTMMPSDSFGSQRLDSTRIRPFSHWTWSLKNSRCSSMPHQYHYCQNLSTMGAKV
jgi:hypothetical protein